jgi:hypothetical protein
MSSANIALPVLSFLLIGVCWVVSSPPAAGVDEGSHYVRMVGIAHGELIGRDAGADTALGGLAGDQLARVREEAGVFEIPGNLTAPDYCNALHADEPFDCAPPIVRDHSQPDTSLHGRSLPIAYFAPAVLSLGGSTTWRALVLGRLGFLMQNAALLLVALLAIRRCRLRLASSSLAMLALSVTPLLAFESGTLAPNGTETMAVVAFACALLAALRTRSSRWLWIATVVGCVASWARDLGALQVAVFGVVLLAVHREATRWLWGRRRTRDLGAAVLLAAAGLGSVIWQLRFKAPVRASLESPGRGWADIGRVVQLLRNSIGLLGWLNVPIDPTVEALWVVGWVLGIAVLFRRAERRTQLAVMVLGAVYVVLNLYLISNLRNAGFASQSRYTLAFPIIAVIALVAAQPERAERAGWRAQVPLAAACAVVGIGHFSGLLVSAHRNANGLNGAAIDFAHAVWTPPGGWALILAGFVVASGSVMVLPALAARGSVDCSAAAEVL